MFGGWQRSPPATRLQPRCNAGVTSVRRERPRPGPAASRGERMPVYAAPGREGSPARYESRYDNWIGGQRVAPVKGQYFTNPSPVTGKTFCEVARGTAEDIELALDAAHAAAPAWGRTSVTERSNILLKIADRMEQNLEALAVAETWDNGKPAQQTPASIMYWIDLVGDLLPDGVLNIVNGFGVEAGKPLASSSRIGKIAFTGETTTGRLIMQYASQNLIPVTLELGGKSPNIFFEDVAIANDAFYDKALEGFTMFALNQGEVCTCPSRALIQSSIYDQFIGDAAKRTEAIVQGNPLDTATMIGAQASNDQLEKILSYIDIGLKEGATLRTGGHRAELDGDLAGGFYVQPTVFEGTNNMRIFQEQIFGPVLSVTNFADE